MKISEFRWNKELSFVFCEIIEGVQELEYLVNETVKKYKVEPKTHSISNRLKSLYIAEIISAFEYNRMRNIIDLRNYLAHKFFLNCGKSLKKYVFPNNTFTGEYLHDLILSKEIVWEAIDFINNKLDPTSFLRPNLIEGNNELMESEVFNEPL